MSSEEWDWSRRVVDHLDIHASDFALSVRFYQTVLAPLGIPKLYEREGEACFTHVNVVARTPPTSGLHLCFHGRSRADVDAFHRAGSAAGFRSNGEPGLRDYGPGYYAAYLLDPDGNNIEALHRGIGSAGYVGYLAGTGGFGRWHADYERGRPGWPAEVVDVPGLAPTATVLELGAGTGKLTRLLVSAFARVVAVEPDEGMRRLLLALAPEADVLTGHAEEIPLAAASVDAVFVAEAFHLLGERALAEIARVLRPGGLLVVMWNLPVRPAEPPIDAVERLLTERAPRPDELGYDPVDLNSRRYASGEWRRPFAGSPFDDLQEARLANPQTVDRDGLVGFFASMGWLAELPDAEQAPLLEEVRSLLPASEYERLWETHLHWTRLASR